MSHEAPSRPVNLEAVAFDLDGTLLDTLADVSDAYNGVLSAHGLPRLSPDFYRSIIGVGIAECIRRITPEEFHTGEALERLSEEYRAIYNGSGFPSTRPYPGILELLSALGERGMPMAVVSNKNQAAVEACLGRFFPGVRFTIALGVTPALRPKPAPDMAVHIASVLETEPGRMCLAGDTPIDIETALASGMYPVGVSWGFRSAGELERAGAARILHHPQELLDLLR